MTWIDLFAESSAQAWRSQLVLDCALDVVAASRCNALEAAIVSRTPTLQELCALLDAFGVGLPEHLSLPSWTVLQDGEQGARKNLPTDAQPDPAAAYPMLPSGAHA